MISQQHLQLILFTLACSSTVKAHSWIEHLNVIAPNGTFVDPPGYPRGNVQRTQPGFSDPLMVNLIPPDGAAPIVQPSQLMCRASQSTQNQTDGSPRLSAQPGAKVALRYQENGHVTLPQNQPGKPPNRGTNFVYYTTNSQPDDKFLAIHRVWNVDGSGGDGRGRLLSTQNFDDSQCYQINNGQISQTRQKEFPHPADKLQGADLWCQQDIQIPLDAKPGSTITLYWVWDWPTMPGTPGFPNGKQEIYTTCMDIDIKAANTVSNKATSAGFVQQNVGDAAVPGQFSDIANPTAVPSPDAIPFANAATSGSQISGLATSTAAVTPSSVSTSQEPCTHSGSNDQTVTVTETVTVQSPVSTTSVPVVTVTQDDQVTVTVTNTPVQKRQTILPEIISILEGFEPHPTIISTSTVQSPSTQQPCSKTAAPYRLKARAPFYILPPSDNDNGGC